MFLEKLLLPPGGNETTLSPDEISFATSARDFIDSVTPYSWFGPQQPMLPQAPKGTLPRSFDYNFGVNMMQQPRTEQPGLASFSQLRALADNCDVLREVIEHRKKQIVKIPWLIRPKTDPQEAFAPRVDPAARTANQSVTRNIRFLTDFLARPDRQHDWTGWMGMVLEEVFVIDALSIWPTYDKYGKMVALNLIDGATIKPLHDEQGWWPNPPNPSFQQYIKGMPSVNMTNGMCDQCLEYRQMGQVPPNHRDGTSPCNPLIYQPRNPRINKFYGFSNVEWIIRTILLAINRQMSQIAYYTEGNVPEMIVQAPQEWNRDEITAFQKYFDTMAGDIGKRRRITFVPKTDGITQTKDAMLTDKMDEWLARVFCFAFGVSPQPFIHVMNRATAQVASESAAEEGTVPELEYIKGVMNYIIRYCFFIEDVEFVWKADADSDNLRRMRVDTGYARLGIIEYDEVRAGLGLHRKGLGSIMATNRGPVPVTPESMNTVMASLTQKGGNKNGSDGATD